MTDFLPLLQMEFLQPKRLWWLIVPALVALLHFGLATRPGMARGPRMRSKLDFVVPKDRAWKRWVAVGTSIAAMCALVLAYAQPKAYTEVPRDRATIVVVIDVSRSMMAEDVKPNRMDAARTAAKEFIGMLPPRFNVALVQFAGTANIVVPPTVDRGAVSRAIDNLKMAPSTAIGEGIYKSLDAIKMVPPDKDNPDKAAPAAIVLLSDGATNSGRSSSTAAKDAKEKGVPVYTIAYGSANGYVVENGQRQPVPVNHGELSDVAKQSGGKKFSAESIKQLQEVYKAIAQSVGYERVYVEVTNRYAGYALVLGIVAALSVISLAARWP